MFLKKKTVSSEPKTILLIGSPKVGKTTITSQLPNSIILDYEDGTNYINHNAVFDVPKSTKEDWFELKKIVHQFDFCIVDTATSMEHWLSENIVKKYNLTAKPELKVKSITEMPYGQGYGLLRTETVKHIEFLTTMFKKVIFIGHCKDKQVSENTTQLELALTGKNSDIFQSRMDVIGFLYRDQFNLIVSFMSSSKIAGGSRCNFLEGKEIVISSKTEKGIETNWVELYPETLKTKNKGEKK